MVRSEHKFQGRRQTRGCFAGYLSLFTTCNFIVGYSRCLGFVGYLYSSTERQSPQFWGGGYNSAGRARGEDEATHWAQRFPSPMFCR